jgi:hypothetical protein
MPSTSSALVDDVQNVSASVVAIYMDGAMAGAGLCEALARVVEQPLQCILAGATLNASASLLAI